MIYYEKDLEGSGERLKSAGIPLIPQFEAYLSISAKNEELVPEIKEQIAKVLRWLEDSINEDDFICEFCFGGLNWEPERKSLDPNK